MRVNDQYRHEEEWINLKEIDWIGVASCVNLPEQHKIEEEEEERREDYSD